MADEFALLRNAFGGSVSVPIDVRNRLKLVFIPYDEMLFAFRPKSDYEYLNFQLAIDSPKLPADAYVIGVNQEFNRQGFSLLVCSKEFDVVPPGEVPPYCYSIDGYVDLAKLKVLVLKKQPDGSYREAK